MPRPFTLFPLLAILTISAARAQDTLPNIAVKNINNHIIISWKNTYGRKIDVINIQRSYDSTRNFTSIGSVLNPMNAQNGFVDNKPVNVKMFYRVFVAFEDGDYIFSKSHRPVKDTVTAVPVVAEPVKPAEPGGFVPSKFVFTGKENNVIINLPDAPKRKISIRFFDEADAPVFEIKQITEPYLIIEKVNFLHGGWYHYQLYDDGVLLEKYKFFIPKELK